MLDTENFDTVAEVEEIESDDSATPAFADKVQQGVNIVVKGFLGFMAKCALLGGFLISFGWVITAVSFIMLFVTIFSVPMLSFPLTAVEDTFDIDLGTNINVNTSVGGSGNNHAAGTRYTWDETAKLATVSDSETRNLYKFCMLHYQALTDCGLDQKQRMDYGLGFFKIETGYFKNVNDILTDYVYIRNYSGYTGVYQIDPSYVNSNGRWDWDRYKGSSGRSGYYVPDAVFWTVNQIGDLFNTNADPDSTKTVSDYHHYNSHIKKACEHYGLDYRNEKVRLTLLNQYYYLKHAGGIWRDDWGDASADYLAWFYKEVCNEDYQNIQVLNIDSIDSSVIQALGKNSSLSESQLNQFTINGSPMTKSALKMYEEVNSSNAAVLYKYLNSTEYNHYPQAVMAVTTSPLLPAVGQALMMKALKAVGYTENDIVFDDLGYACFPSKQGQADNTIGSGTGNPSFEDNKWATFLVSSANPSYTTVKQAEDILNVFKNDSLIGDIVEKTLNSTYPATETKFGVNIITAGGPVLESELANGTLTAIPNSFLSAMVNQMQQDLGNRFGEHSSAAGMGYRTFYQASYDVNGVLQVSQSNGYWGRTLGAYSEHCLGVAVDFDISYKNSGAISGSGLTNRSGSSDANKEFKWLADNAHKYGFIWRFKISGAESTATNRTTNTIYEGWHWRFVGVYHATQFWKKCSSDGVTGYNTNDNYLWEDYYYENIASKSGYPKTAYEAITSYYNETKGNLCTYANYIRMS